MAQQAERTSENRVKAKSSESLISSIFIGGEARWTCEVAR